jgi:hypothetical protein
MFYCYAPAFAPNSNGIKVLYLLAKYLNERGVDTKVLCYEDEGFAEIPTAPKNSVIFLNKRRLEIHKNDIVLYSETESGNPMGATQIVRFFGNRPYYLSGKGIEYTRSDFLTAHSRAIDPDLPQLFIMEDETELMRKLRNVIKSNELSIYYGKVSKHTIIRKIDTLQQLLPRFDKVHLLTRYYPERRIDLLEVIARSRLLVSFDPLSNTFYEATLLNTPVILMDNAFAISPLEFNIPLWGISYSVQDFVKIEKEVRYAFTEYQVHLKSQPEMVHRWSDSVRIHFDRIYVKNDAAYLQKNASRLGRQREIDRLRFSTFHHRKPLVNMWYPTDLPMRVLRALHQKDYILAKQKTRTLKKLLKRLLKKIGMFIVAYSIWRALGLNKRRRSCW